MSEQVSTSESFDLLQMFPSQRQDSIDSTLWNLDIEKPDNDIDDDDAFLALVRADSFQSLAGLSNHSKKPRLDSEIDLDDDILFAFDRRRASSRGFRFGFSLGLREKIVVHFGVFALIVVQALAFENFDSDLLFTDSRAERYFLHSLDDFSGFRTVFDVHFNAISEPDFPLRVHEIDDQ